MNTGLHKAFVSVLLASSPLTVFGCDAEVGSREDPCTALGLDCPDSSCEPTAGVADRERSILHVYGVATTRSGQTYASVLVDGARAPETFLSRFDEGVLRPIGRVAGAATSLASGSEPLVMGGSLVATDGMAWAPLAEFAAAQFADDGSRLFAVLPDGEVRRSTNGGVSWTTLAGRGPPEARQFEADGNTLWIVGSGHPFVSRDGGATFIEIGLPGSEFFRPRPGIVFVRGVGGQWRSVDEGESFDAHSGPWPTATVSGAVFGSSAESSPTHVSLDLTETWTQIAVPGELLSFSGAGDLAVALEASTREWVRLDVDGTRSRLTFRASPTSLSTIYESTTGEAVVVDSVVDVESVNSTATPDDPVVVTSFPGSTTAVLDDRRVCFRVADTDGRLTRHQCTEDGGASIYDVGRVDGAVVTPVREIDGTLWGVYASDGITRIYESRDMGRTWPERLHEFARPTFQGITADGRVTVVEWGRYLEWSRESGEREVSTLDEGTCEATQLAGILLCGQGDQAHLYVPASESRVPVPRGLLDTHALLATRDDLYYWADREAPAGPVVNRSTIVALDGMGAITLATLRAALVSSIVVEDDRIVWGGDVLRCDGTRAATHGVLATRRP